MDFSINTGNDSVDTGGWHMSLPEGLYPEKVFYYFEEISKIPHASGNTKDLAKYIQAFADERKLKNIVDSYGNVIIFADGTEGYEQSKPIILQGHIDMVAVKKADIDHDFSKDPLKLAVDGDMLYAEGTTLGGDDGIAVAYMLAILDDPTIPHPPLDCVFTADEEVGMLGAYALDMSVLRSTMMINLDSEEEGVFSIGCAGGARVDEILPLKRVSIRGLPVVVQIDGLNGGHSGEMIDRCLASANILMGRFLYELDAKAAYSLDKVAGGEKDNAIAISAKAHLVIDEEDFGQVEEFAKEFERTVQNEYRGADDNIRVHVSRGDVHRIKVIDPECQDKLVFLLLHAPYGVIRMSTDVSGAIQTSSNPGIVRTTDTEFVCANLIRSSETSAKQAVISKIRSLAAVVGAQVRMSGVYHEWKYQKHSVLRNKMENLYEEMNGKKPVVRIMHGGVECGVFSEQIKCFDAVSIGPDIKDVHTVNERLSVSSAARVFDYLLKLLAELK